MPDSRRERLIDRIRLLPVEKLDHVEEFLTRLECGDSSPLLQETLSRPRMNASAEEQRSPAASSTLKSGDQSPHSKDWPHAPVHRISEHGTYIVTAGTLHRQHWFRGPDRLDLLHSALLRLARQFGWHLEAWAVFSNHYHFVAHSQEGAKDLRVFVKQLHGETSHDLNLLDKAAGRSVWHNFWDTRLTFEKSYLARLNYVHQNAVKYRLVPVANQYRWCSAAWFEQTASPAQVKTIYSFKTDKLRVIDDFEPV